MKIVLPLVAAFLLFVGCRDRTQAPQDVSRQGTKQVVAPDYSSVPTNVDPWSGGGYKYSPDWGRTSVVHYALTNYGPDDSTKDEK